MAGGSLESILKSTHEIKGGVGEERVKKGSVFPFSSASLVENLGCFHQVLGAGLCVLYPLSCIHSRQHPPYLDSLCTVFVPLMNHNLY